MGVTTTSLAMLDRVTQMLAEVNSLDDVKDVIDYAGTVQLYARKAGLGLEAQNQAAEVKILAECMAGEMLAGMEKQHGVEMSGSNIVLPPDDVPTLADLGLTKIQSHRWQLQASVPEELRAEYFAAAREEQEELTSAGLRRLARRLTHRTQTGAPPPPEGQYRCLIIDPPWPMKKIEREVRPRQIDLLDYPTMSLQEIKEHWTPQKADPNGCHFYLWTIHRFLPAAFDIFAAWGVNYQCLLTWVKNVGFTPYSWMYSTEHILFGRIGNLPLLKNGLRLDFSANVREHSRKPDAFYELVQQVSPEPRLDIFSREPHEGFDQWGDEPAAFAARLD